MTKLREIVRTVAPALATALGGPLAGTAVRALSEKLLGRPDGSVEEVEAVLATATTEQIIELKRLDKDFKSTLLDAGIKLEELEEQSRTRATNMFVATRDPTVSILTVSIVVVWGVVQWALFTRAVPQDSHDMIARMLGTLDAALMAVLYFWFGSSKGSRDKADAINALVERG